MTRGAAGAEAAVALYQHAWGLWTALTTTTRQRYDGERLRVFETWPALEDLQASASSASGMMAGTDENSALSTGPRSPRRVSFLRLRADANALLDTPAGIEPDGDRILGAVKFSPEAAAHVRRQGLLEKATLQALLTGGATAVPPFPSSAVVAKPVYQIVRTSTLRDQRYALLRVWTGPPASPGPAGPETWTAGVWVDLGDGGAGTTVDPLPAADGSTRTAASTYPVSTFIHHRLSVADAAELNAAGLKPTATAGDTLLLVAMHITSREIARWTWQTFWWTPDPAAPPLPSSAAIAAARLLQAGGTAGHYAMALAYSMLAPSEPYLGGANDAPAVYAYSPWIEARFAPADLPDSQPGLAPDGFAAANNTGVETNCMSCHAHATYAPVPGASLGFTGARYVDLGDPRFVGTVQTEFLWTLARHAR